MCSHNINFIHKIKNSFKSIWLLRFYGFPFSFHFFGFYQTTRSISSVQYFSIKKLLRISAKVLRLMFGWIPVSQNSPDSQCDWVFFHWLSYNCIGISICPFSSSNCRYHRNFSFSLNIYTQIHITCISIVCCCGILLPNLVSTCGSLIGCIRSPSASTSPSVSSLHFYYLETFFPLHWNSTLIARRTLATMRFKNRKEKKFFFFSF